MIEEAKKRDHRKLGQEMELFFFDPEFVGPGLPMWLPRGTVLIEELEKLAKETEFAAGYDRVRTPALARENMYLTSGHLPYYEDAMWPAVELYEDRETRNKLKTSDDRMLSSSKAWFDQLGLGSEEFTKAIEAGISAQDFVQGRLQQVDEQSRTAAIENLIQLGFVHVLRTGATPPNRYYLKAMNCPHHHKLFGAVPRSYRDLPLRLAEYGTCYRYEQIGELFGLNSSTNPYKSYLPAAPTE